MQKIEEQITGNTSTATDIVTGENEVPVTRDEAEATLTKADIIECLYEQIGLNRREAKEIVEAFLEEICHVLEQGGIVKLSGFGNFEVRYKNERPGRNPKTGEEIPISARRVVTFRPGHKLKTRVKAYAGCNT